MKPAMYRRNSWLPTGGWFPTVLDEWLNTDVMNSANNVAPSVNVKENLNGYTVVGAGKKPGKEKSDSVGGVLVEILIVDAPDVVGLECTHVRSLLSIYMNRLSFNFPV